MIESKIVWLASYPRSGNTLLRTILWHCFGLRSASLYPNDLGGNERLEWHTGHVEQGPGNRIAFPPGALPLIKTHEFNGDAHPAIYVLRDGRAAAVSLWRFYDKKLPLQDVVAGKHRFGTWSDHLRSWNPWERKETLLLRYEDLLTDFAPVIRLISAFLDAEIVRDRIPARNSIAAVDHRWVKPKTSWRGDLHGELLRRFNRENREMLIKSGYWD